MFEVLLARGAWDWLSGVGTVAFALSGYLIGVRKRFDWLGIAIVALLTAIGGGILRDVLLNRIPVIFHDAEPVAIVALTLVVARAARLHRRPSGVDGAALRRLFIVADSIGLVAFSLAGAQLGIQYGLNLFGVLFVGFVTAVGGGIVRDMMVNDVPFILHQDVYGTISILVAALLYLAHAHQAASPQLIWALFALGLTVRLVAHARELRLPGV
jgi:uncharacterized membrane protein YeiH